MTWEDFADKLSGELRATRIPFWTISRTSPSMRDNFINTESRLALELTSICPDVSNLVVEAHVGTFEGKASALVDVANSTEGGWVSKHNLDTSDNALSLAARDAVIEIVRPLVTESQLDLYKLEHARRAVVLPYGFNAQLIQGALGGAVGVFSDDVTEPLCVYSLKSFQVYESAADGIRHDSLRRFQRIDSHSFERHKMSLLAPQDWTNLFALWISSRAFRTLEQLLVNPKTYSDYCKAIWAAPKRLARSNAMDFSSGLSHFGPSSQLVKARLAEIKGR
jgi:hypothetical protein